MQLTGSDIIVRTLIEQGVDVVFGYPGGQVIHIYDSLYKYQDELRHVLTAHEQGASHAADGYSRATGKVGVCIATSGPGATNLVTGIATAYMDSSPVVFITCNVAEDLLGKDSFQEVDITGVTAHPMSSKNNTVNPILIATDFINLLDRGETPEHTEKTEGYIWVQGIEGNQLNTTVKLNIRDHDRQKFLEEEVLVTPSGHVEVAIPCVMYIGSASVGHDDDNGKTLARTDEFVHNRLHLSLVAPGPIVVAQAVQEIDDGVFLPLVFTKSVGQIDIARHIGREYFALHCIGYDTACYGGQAKQQQQCCKR